MAYVELKLFAVALFVLVLAQAIPAQALPLNQWSISCSVGKGAIKRRANVWTFRTSKNKCSNGSWKQRAEIRTEKISPNHKGAYLFRTTVAMTARRREKFDIFQIHDGRSGCAPPLKLTVLGSGQIELVSEINKNSGKRCIRTRLSSRFSRDRLKRDGTEQELKVLVEFDGRGGFVATVWIDGVVQISGTYKSPSIKGAYKSRHFYFKHGVYSPKIFTYEMTSRGMKVAKVRVIR